MVTRTCEKISECSTSSKDGHGHREKAKVVRTCQWKGRWAHAKKNGRCTNTRKETERKAENQEEREKTLVKAIWKVWVKGGGHIIQYTVEGKVKNHFCDPRRWEKHEKKKTCRDVDAYFP